MTGALPRLRPILNAWLAAVLAGAAGCGPPAAVPGPAERLYQGMQPPLALRFVYPSAWRLTEEQGTLEPYAELRLLGPRNEEDTYTASITVRAIRPADDPALPLEVRVREYRDHLPDGAVVERHAARKLEQAPAEDLAVSWTVPPLFRSGLKPLPIPVKTRAVLFRRGPYLYELIYSADARDYAAHEPVFERLLASLRFPSAIREG